MNQYIVKVNGVSYEVEIEKTTAAASGSEGLSSKNQSMEPVNRRSGNEMAATSKVEQKSVTGSVNGLDIPSPMQGKIVDIPVQVGQTVTAGSVLAILEAMKMENEIVAPKAGIIRAIHASAGLAVEANTVLMTIE